MIDGSPRRSNGRETLEPNDNHFLLSCLITTASTASDSNEHTNRLHFSSNPALGLVKYGYGDGVHGTGLSKLFSKIHRQAVGAIQQVLLFNSDYSRMSSGIPRLGG